MLSAVLRLDPDRVLVLRSIARRLYGADTSLWSSDALANLGPIASYMADLEIERFNTVSFNKFLNNLTMFKSKEGYVICLNLYFQFLFRMLLWMQWQTFSLQILLLLV